MNIKKKEISWSFANDDDDERREKKRREKLTAKDEKKKMFYDGKFIIANEKNENVYFPSKKNEKKFETNKKSGNSRASYTA